MCQPRLWEFHAFLIIGGGKVEHTDRDSFAPCDTYLITRLRCYQAVPTFNLTPIAGQPL